MTFIYEILIFFFILDSLKQHIYLFFLPHVTKGVKK